MVIPLHQCISRPDEEAGGLITHLKAVAVGCGPSNGTVEDKLAHLAGLAHDAAKAAPAWQDYIRGRLKKGPPHAPLGAALFAVWAEELIGRWEPDRSAQQPLRDLALDWVRVIYRHHGALDDLTDDPPWVGPLLSHDNADLLATCDLAGLEGLVRESFPEYAGSLLDFRAALGRIDSAWQRRSQVVRSAQIRNANEESKHAVALRVAQLGARLIFADRSHAAGWEPDCLTAEDAQTAIDRHRDHCEKEAEKARGMKADEALLRARIERQEEALRTYQANASERVFKLLLPTGYGKTMTGLRVALDAVASGQYRRIIYVAPYISILSQAAGEIAKATGVEVFTHHHLSVLQDKADPQQDAQKEDHQPTDLMDSWQAPILATTFNQLFRALFPARAQECARIPALDGAFLFIDEPQIVDVKVWCAFLRALAIVSKQRHCQVLFSTATLPPLEDGLGAGVPVVALVGQVAPAVSRYVIRYDRTPWDARRAAGELRERFNSHGSVAGIFNTVRDAVEVYRGVSPEASWEWFFLAAMMLPGHKREIIQQVRDRLRPKVGPPVPTGVVCTQVLEAGVDLSFRSLLRALPIFPSIAQAAGRANRHGEGEAAEVVVFPFEREGKDTRIYVYKDRAARDATDNLLGSHPVLTESGIPEALDSYYRKCWETNPHTTSLQLFDAAALGCWCKLAELEPFGGSYPMVDVFVPGAERYLSERLHRRMRDFGADSAEGVLRISLDPKARRGLDRVQKKELSALLRQFLVSVPARLTYLLERVDPTDWLYRLADAAEYSEQTGLAHLLASDEGEASAMII